MIDLKHAVQEKGFTVAHIKTDSIKIPNGTPEIIQFVMDFGEKYGYTFEHEATYEKLCLVNDAVYIAKTKGGKWTAVGAQFAQPFVFKTLFSKEPLVFEDFCETKNVSSSLYLDMNEGLPDVSKYDKALDYWNKEWADSPAAIPSASIKERDYYENEISKGHNYHFVGKVGSFCPMKKGCGGGILLREKEGKYYAATGSKGYRWLEAEMVKMLNKEGDIDVTYYEKLADSAVDTISKFGDLVWFVSDEPLKKKRDENTPPWALPCGNEVYTACVDCPNWIRHPDSQAECKLGYEDCLPF